MGARRHAARRQRHSEGLVVEGERRQPLQHVDRGTQPVGHRGHHRTERRRRDGHLRRPRGERRHHHHHQERPPQPGDARQRLGIAVRDRPSRPLAPQPDERLAEGRSGAGAGGERPTQLPAGHGRRSPHPGQGRGAPGARQRRKPRIALPRDAERDRRPAPQRHRLGPRNLPDCAQPAVQRQHFGRQRQDRLLLLGRLLQRAGNDRRNGIRASEPHDEDRLRPAAEPALRSLGVRGAEQERLLPLRHGRVHQPVALHPHGEPLPQRLQSRRQLRVRPRHDGQYGQHRRARLQLPGGTRPHGVHAQDPFDQDDFRPGLPSGEGIETLHAVRPAGRQLRDRENGAGKHLLHPQVSAQINGGSGSAPAERRRNPELERRPLAVQLESAGRICGHVRRKA